MISASAFFFHEKDEVCKEVEQILFVQVIICFYYVLSLFLKYKNSEQPTSADTFRVSTTRKTSILIFHL